MIFRGVEGNEIFKMISNIVPEQSLYKAIVCLPELVCITYISEEFISRITELHIFSLSLPVHWEPWYIKYDQDRH